MGSPVALECSTTRTTFGSDAAVKGLTAVNSDAWPPFASSFSEDTFVGTGAGVAMAGRVCCWMAERLGGCSFVFVWIVQRFWRRNGMRVTV